MSCGVKEAVVFSLGLITGTGTTLTGKVLYGIDTVGSDGEVHKFEKPVFQTWLMFAAMIFALPIQWGYHWYLTKKWHQNGFFGKKPPRIPTRTYFLLMIPAAFDLIASFLANVGLLYVTVSAFQLMKCTVIIFVALFKVTFLKDRLSGYMWIGIGLNTLAVLLVGITSFGDKDEQNNSGSPGFGLIMIVLSCLVQSCQYVYEEKLMGEEVSTPPLIVVGMEGLWGLFLTTFVVYPIAYLTPGNDLGSNERFDVAWTMLMSSQFAQTVVLIYVFAILGYNVFAVFVTYLLNSVWHAILDNFRPISVWGVDLLLFYVFTNGVFGEAWTSWSWLQLSGMILLLTGTAVYNGTLQLPGFVYDEPSGSDSSLIRTPREFASSSLSRSPLITRGAVRAEKAAQRTPDLMDRDRVRQQYLTEYQDERRSGEARSGEARSGEAKSRLEPARRSYGSMQA